MPWVVLGFSAPSLASAEKAWEPYALEVAMAALSGGKSSRLNSDLVRGKELVQSASGGYDFVNLYPGLFYLEATPSQGKTPEEVVEALRQEVASLQHHPLEESELARVKAQVLASQTFRRDSLEHMAEECGQLEIIGRSCSDAEKFSERIQEISPQQVQAVAQKYLKRENSWVAQLLPETKTQKVGA